MTTIHESLKQSAAAAWRAVESPPRTRVAVTIATCSLAAGAAEALAAIRDAVAQRGLDVDVAIVGDNGFCWLEPTVMVSRPDGSAILYGRVTADAVPYFVDQALATPGVARDLAVAVVAGPDVPGVPRREEMDIWKLQTRRLMARCGVIDPGEIDHYLATGGYEGLAKAVAMSQEDVIQEVSNAGLWGRGGAAFPTGRKWDFLRSSQRRPKYMVCNADEGDPGAFVNRVLMESDPHLVLEGIAIGGYATGAEHAFIYIRNEYPLAAERMTRAIEQAREKGVLGKSVLGSGFAFDMQVVRGGGSYVCGEESGLIASVEGLRGMPKIRPPYPAQSGVFTQPTNVNNVETYANVPLILGKGAAWYAEMGTEKNKGTKMFSLSGHIEKVCVLEVPFGTPVRALFEAAGGCPGGRTLKAIQAGGPLAGILPAEFVDIPLEPEAFRERKALMGGGGIVFMDDSTCMVDINILFSWFAEDESCGRCTTCHGGTQRMTDILKRVGRGGGREADFDNLRLLGRTLVWSNCAHGQGAPTIMLNTLEYFQNEFREHVLEKRCRAKRCKGLIRYRVANQGAALQEAAAICPTDAFVREGSNLQIDDSRCIRCDACRALDPHDIEVVDAFAPAEVPAG